VKILDSYSAHGDYKEMIQTLKCQDTTKVKKVFIVHGEYETQLSYKEKLTNEGFHDIVIPEKGQAIEI
jgi:metallo-beta-lactamase family protein